MLFQVILLLFGCHLSITTISLIKYENAQFIPNTDSQMINMFNVQLQNECICNCITNEKCLIVTYFGINKTCLLFSSKFQIENLRLVTYMMNAVVLIFPNKITSTTSTSSTTTTTTTVTTTSTSSTTTMTTTVTTTSTTTTNQICGYSCVNTTISTLSRVAFYSFDNNTSDSVGIYSMNGILSPKYVPGWVGSAISFKYNEGQFLSTSYIPLNSRSFTIDFWFYSTDITSSSDFSFGGEEESPSNNKCLFLNIRGKVLYMGFYFADTAGITTLSINQWYHATFVYDSSIKQQSIYLNGLLEKSSTINDHLLATTGSFTIGGAYIGGAARVIEYYSGYIDHFTISYRVKTPCEIYLSAILACYFSFNSFPSIIDSGPNFLTAINNGAISTTGRANQALQFSSSLSYITINGISALYSVNTDFTISMWIKPDKIIGGATLIHTSTQSDGKDSCLAIWGLTSNGLMTVNLIDSLSNTITITTSTLSVNTWIHVAQVFNSIQGNSLYINGVLVANVAISTRRSIGPYIFLGASPMNTSSCQAGSISMGQFFGSIDEFYVFGRALTSTDICRLANP